MRIIGIYHTAAVRVHENEIEHDKHRRTPALPPPQREGGGLRCDEWTRAVVKGADDRSRRWQHLLVLTGVLMGMEGNDRRALSRGLRNTLEQAVVTAANLALEHNVEDGLLAAASIVTALNFAFPLLSDHYKAQINCSALLPMTIWAVTGEEGFCDGEFLKAAHDQHGAAVQAGRLRGRTRARYRGGAARTGCPDRVHRESPRQLAKDGPEQHRPFLRRNIPYARDAATDLADAVADASQAPLWRRGRTPDHRLPQLAGPQHAHPRNGSKHCCQVAPHPPKPELHLIPPWQQLLPSLHLFLPDVHRRSYQRSCRLRRVLERAAAGGRGPDTHDAPPKDPGPFLPKRRRAPAAHAVCRLVREPHCQAGNDVLVPRGSHVTLDDRAI